MRGVPICWPRGNHPLTFFMFLSMYQMADIFAKAYDSSAKWKHACALVGLLHEDNPLSAIVRNAPALPLSSVSSSVCAFDV